MSKAQPKPLPSDASPQARRVDPDRPETELKDGHPLRAAPQDPEVEARSRAIACHEEIGRVLDRMRCRLVPMIADPEPVGSSGDRIQIRATYAIVPQL